MKNNKLIYLIAFFGGFLSLSQEILWMRIISFAGMTVPQAFSFTLALFLLGIAIGAHIGKNICNRYAVLTIDMMGRFFFTAAIVDVLLIFINIFFVKQFGISIILMGVSVLICAIARGVIFPVVHHIGTADSKTGKQISNVYFCNVVGSALAPLLISFIFLDILNTQQVYGLICALTFMVVLLCSVDKKIRGISITLIFFSLMSFFIPEKLFHELSSKEEYASRYPHTLIENKHGFIQVYNDGNQDIVYGANVYDGKFNTNIFNNTNGIDRAYLLASLKPKAKNILIIGLSTGSWAQVLSYLPYAEQITIIEINPSYVDLIEKYPEVSNLLKDKRINIVNDDGRKWLKKNKNQKYDIILMNTTWHWRAYASNLLSVDFLKILKESINDDGIIFYNATQSLDAYFSAKQIFPYVYKYKFMVMSANSPQTFTREMIRNNLCSLIDHKDNRAIFTVNECEKAMLEILKEPFEPYEQIDFSRLGRAPEIITDNNMISEYKYGKGL